MKILVIKTSAFGDIVHVFPAIQLIRQIIPEASIDWVVEDRCKSLVEAHPLVDKVHIINTKKWKKGFFLREILQNIKDLRSVNYDLIFDFQGNTKSGILMGLARGKTKIGFGKKSVAEFPNLLFSTFKVDPDPNQNIRQDYLDLVERWFGRKGDYTPTLLLLNSQEKRRLEELKNNLDKKNILICPGSNWENKRLSYDQWRSYVKNIEGKLWVLQNSLEERVFAEHFKGASVLESLSIPLLQHFMREMDLVLSVDSLPLHLAGEAGVPTRSFFGPSLASKYAPQGGSAFQGECPYGQKFTKRCVILRACKTGACMKGSLSAIIVSAGELEKENSLN